MSFLIAAPEFVAAAASDLANIGSAITQNNATALVPTSGVLAAGGDEVSATIAALFGRTPRRIRRSGPKRRLFTSSSCNS